MDYKGFYVTIEVRSETIYAYWCNDVLEDSRRFSGYSISEIKEIIRQDIDYKLIYHTPDFDYNKYYPTEEDFPKSDISEIIVKHGMVVTDELIQLAKACWAEAKIHNETQLA